jgi:hypothetical protein
MSTGTNTELGTEPGIGAITAVGVLVTDHGRALHGSTAHDPDGNRFEIVEC